MEKNQIDILLKEHTKLNNKALDWLFASWEKTGEEKELCLSMYKKYKKQAHQITKKILNI